MRISIQVSIIQILPSDAQHFVNNKRANTIFNLNFRLRFTLSQFIFSKVEYKLGESQACLAKVGLQLET